MLAALPFIVKPEVLQTLLTAKVLLAKAQETCLAEDQHSASAGLIVLQDALELIFLAALIERGVDESGAIEKLSFEQMIGELKKSGISVPKSGTLKALNKQRVIVKHYGQLAEAATVARYLDAALQVIDSVLEQTVGHKLDEVFIHELIRDHETKEFLSEAAKAIEERKYFKAVANVRKAIYLQFEQNYSVYEYRKDSQERHSGLLGLFAVANKAPHYTRNAGWIEKNVKNPFDYIQLDHDRLKNELIEWGANTQDFFNVCRLTPEVIRLEPDGEWLLKGELKHLYQGATRNNAIFCLDRAIYLVWKKQCHMELARWLDYSPDDQLRVRITREATVHAKADGSSQVLTTVPTDTVLEARSVVPGLNSEGRFVNVFHERGRIEDFISGYIDFEHCEVLSKRSDGDG